MRRIARLARIRLEESEVESLARELGSILDWVELLREVDVSGVAPLAGAAEMTLEMRPDVVADGGVAEAVLANAPDRAGDYFAVPKVIE